MFTSIEEAHQIFSDIFKDAYGFRPRFDRSDWTLEKFNNECEYLQSMIETNIIEENLRKQKATKAFMALVEKCKEHGAKDDADAIRWLLQADGVDMNDYYDVEYWMYNNDISYTPYGTYVQAIITANARD